VKVYPPNTCGYDDRVNYCILGGDNYVYGN